VTQRIELSAAAEEIGTLDKMAEGVRDTISELSAKRSGADVASAVAIGVGEARGNLLRAYQELAHHVYGRSVLGRVTDDDGKEKRSFVYRITQANVSYVDKGCNVLARNSPRASQLTHRAAGRRG
jgi:hypothetical protein